MSNKYITAVLESDVSTQSHFAVLMVLADKANEKGQAWPHLDTLARLSRTGRSTVSAALAKLEEGGYLTKRRRRGDSSIYTLSLKRLTARTSSNQNIQDLDNPDSGSSDSETPNVQDLDGSKETPQRTLKRPKRSKRSDAAKAKTEEHPDARKLCDRLVELLVARKVKRPTISKAWLDAARLLLTNDGRDFDQAMSVLEWSQADRFWHKNVLSMPKFREKYDQLRLSAEECGELRAPAPRLDTAERVREWLKTEWREGRTSEIHRRTGLRYEPPDVPSNVRGLEAETRFHRDSARDWITANHELIIERLTQEADAA